MAPQARRLEAFPRHRLVEEPLFEGSTAELTLLEQLGPPTAESDAAFGDPRFFWDLEFPCGLIVAVEFHPLDEHISVHLDADDVDHALRHLGAPIGDLTLLAERDPHRYRELVPEPCERTASLWRVDADGSETLLATGLTRRDAECRRADPPDGLEQASLRVRMHG